MYTLMRILPVIFALLLMGGVAVAEEEGEGARGDDLAALTKIGADAQDRVEVLIEAYKYTMSTSLREVLAEVHKSEGQAAWTNTIQYVHDIEKGDRASALNAYRTWVSEKGGDATKIENLPLDWATLLDGWEEFYDLCDHEGATAFLALHELAKEGREILGFVFGDDVRLDGLAARGEDIDRLLRQTDALLDELQSGKSTLKDVKPGLERLRSELTNQEIRMKNMKEVVDEILEREKKYNSTKNAAVNRMPAVRDLWNAFEDSVRANVLTSSIHEKEAKKWLEIIEKTVVAYGKYQDLWLDTIDRAVSKRPFKGNYSLENMDVDDCIQAIGDMIGRIDHVL